MNLFSAAPNFSHFGDSFKVLFRFVKKNSWFPIKKQVLYNHSIDSQVERQHIQASMEAHAHLFLHLHILVNPLRAYSRRRIQSVNKVRILCIFYTANLSPFSLHITGNLGLLLSIAHSIQARSIWWLCWVSSRARQCRDYSLYRLTCPARLNQLFSSCRPSNPTYPRLLFFQLIFL